VQTLRRLGEYLLAMGIPGLFVIALLDSAALPMVGGPDGVIILLSWQRPGQFPWIVLSAALGSTIGCLILYRIARAGGDAVLRRMTPQKQLWVREKVEKNATWAVFLGVIAPPPFPTKPVIAAAGLFRTPLLPFVGSVLAGRLLRYSIIAYLGARFGDQAAQIIRSHYLIVLAVLACIALVIFLTRRAARPHIAKQETIDK
jgi:membrane protein YqaA with SNARE-associated domain